MTMKYALLLAGASWFAAATPALAFDPYAFLTAQNGDFGLVDLATGAFTLCGNSGQILAGLAYGPQNLYALSFESSGNATLYVVNPHNGSLASVGAPAIQSAEVFGSTPAQGAFAVNTAGDLYSINTTAGTATKIGPTGVAITGTIGISNGSKKLYLTQDTNVYDLNIKTGAATKLGNGSVNIGALVKSGKNLIGASSPAPVTLQKIKPKNGADHKIAGVSGETATFYGLVAYPGNSTGICPP